MESSKLDYVAAVFLGIRDSKTFIDNKDTAKKMEEDFANSTIDEFFDEMHSEIQQFEGTEDEHRQFCAGVGVLTREFIEYKIKHPIKSLPKTK